MDRLIDLDQPADEGTAANLVVGMRTKNEGWLIKADELQSPLLNNSALTFESRCHRFAHGRAKWLVLRDELGN